jgi:hypothetical protein
MIVFGSFAGFGAVSEPRRPRVRTTSVSGTLPHYSPHIFRSIVDKGVRDCQSRFYYLFHGLVASFARRTNASSSTLGQHNRYIKQHNWYITQRNCYKKQHNRYTKQHNRYIEQHNRYVN